MAVVDRGASGQGSSFSLIVNDERYRSIFYQIIVFAVVMWAGWYLFSNTSENLEARGMSSGFDFLGTTAGFSIAFSIIPYKAGDSYFWVYLVGITNTLLLSLLAIVATTLLGFFIGILRLSKNWMVAQLASWYVEILRNTPLLLQILFWYLAVFSILPRPKQSVDVLGLEIFQLNNRGFYFPAPIPGRAFLADNAHSPALRDRCLLYRGLSQETPERDRAEFPALDRRWHHHWRSIADVPRDRVRRCNGKFRF